MLRRWFIVFVALFICHWGWGTPNGEGEAHFRLGPFFEWGSRDGEGMTRLAIRPFYAWEQSEVHPEDKDMDVLWPLSHFAWRGDAFHWRVLMTFWRERDVTGRRSMDYSFTMPPVWVHGRYQEKNYWGLFPIYGRMPHFLFLEDVQWGMFPGWLRYKTGGSRGVYRDYFLWPFFSLKYDADKTRWALWPLYGTRHEPGYDARYVLWPFWNDRTFHSERPKHNGYAWMLWPLYERTVADTEQGWGVLPPFFRSTRTTDGAHLIRAPWPLFERYTDRKESTWKFWRFWGMTHRGTRAGWWFMYPITVSQRQETRNLRVEKFRIWPFYVNEAAYEVTEEGERLESSYFKIWPFYMSSYHENEGLKRRVLELFPIRDVAAIERNWAPFWTLYTARQRVGEDEILHELFWGLIWWRTKATVEDDGKEEVAL